MATIRTEHGPYTTVFNAPIPCEAGGAGLPIFNYGSKTPNNKPPIFKTVAYVWMDGIYVGDCLDIQLTLQVNNNTSVNTSVECSGQFLIKPCDANDNITNPYTYENTKPISINVGQNVNRDIHHLVTSRRKIYVIPTLWIDGSPHPTAFYLIARWYAGSDDPNVQGQLLDISPYSTELSVIRHRK